MTNKVKDTPKGMIDFKKTPVYYTVHGRGRAVVLLHGFLENLGMWNDIVPELAKKNRVIAIDLLGHGKSGNLGYVHTMEDQAMVVKAVLDHLRLRKYILIGHSLGGYISLAFTELFPESIKGICLMNSSALSDTIEKKSDRERAVTAVKKNYKLLIKSAIPNLFAEENRKIYNIKINRLVEEALQLSPQGIIASLEGMKIRKDRTSLLKNNTFKKMLILGRKDPVLEYQSLIDQTKNTNVKVVELDGGHMSQFENKAALITNLKDFVKSCN